MSILCNTCGEPFDNWHDLAVHTIEAKHKRGRVWAQKFLHKNNLRRDDKFENGRQPLTDEQRESRENTRRELSGAYAYVPTICPHCKIKSTQSLPIEFTEGKDAWVSSNRLVVMCATCGCIR